MYIHTYIHMYTHTTHTHTHTQLHYNLGRVYSDLRTDTDAPTALTPKAAATSPASPTGSSASLSSHMALPCRVASMETARRHAEAALALVPSSLLYQEFVAELAPG